MARLLIKNGRVIDPAASLNAQRDLLIEAGRIKKIAKNIRAPAAKIIDAGGWLVMPGLIDLHAHLRDPGRPDKETIATGTRSAALGGYTSVCAMANTDPPMDNPAVVKYVKNKAETDGVVNVYPVGAVTRGLEGKMLAEMGQMLEEGAIAFSDDGRPVMDARVMRRALEWARQFNVPVIAHCEDISLSKDGVMNEGPLSTLLGLPGIPAISEEIMVSQAASLAREFGRVHIAHVSSAGSVEIIRRAKKKGIKITAETCPHYFCLTEEAVTGYDTRAKVNPPLKSRKDLRAIAIGLRDGTIDAIATDHAPHNIEEKNVEFNRAAFGMVGFETALALVLTRLVETKLLNLNSAVFRMTRGPAKILGLNKGTLGEGADADITIVDPKMEWTVDPQKFASKSKNSPFAGWKLKGKVVYTIVGGKVVVGNGKLLF